MEANMPPSEIVKILRQEHGIETSDKSLRRARKRWGFEGVPEAVAGFEKSGLKIHNDDAEIIATPAMDILTPEDLLIERGLDPEDWDIYDVIVNHWEGAPTRSDQKRNGEQIQIRGYRQLKIKCRRIKPLSLILPPRPDGPVYEPKGRARRSTKDPKLVVFTGDQQAPHFEPTLHDLFCEWMAFNQPEEGVLIGDTLDLPSISRHPVNPEWNPTIQECAQSAYDLLKDYRNSNSDTQWIKLIGNHDERLRRALIDAVNSELYTLTRPKDEGDSLEEQPLLSIRHFMRLDELGIEVVDPGGDYEHAQHNVSSHLAARHGWIATKNSGSSAVKTLEHLGYSVVVGHSHRQSLVYKTTHDINGKTTTLTAAETGCMCKIEGGLGYAVAPDWQQGFATAEVWPDGAFRLDLATYVNGTLLWRDQRYS